VFALNRAGDLRTVEAPVVLGDGMHGLACQYGFDADGAPTLTLLDGGEPIASRTLDVPVPMFWQHGGTALTLGYDVGLPVCDDYDVPFAWTGTLHEVVVEVGRDIPPDPGVELRVALAAE